MANPSNLQQLMDAGLIKPDYQFSPAEQTAIDSLSQAEIDALISSADKLGRDFLEQHSPHGLLF